VRHGGGAQQHIRQHIRVAEVAGQLGHLDDPWRPPRSHNARALTLRVLLGVPAPVPRNWNSMQAIINRIGMMALFDSPMKSSP
jgi:hypothetical protein